MMQFEPKEKSISIHLVICLFPYESPIKVYNIRPGLYRVYIMDFFIIMMSDHWCVRFVVLFQAD